MIYRLLDEPLDIDILGCWEKHMWHYTKVIGYSATGTIFLMSPETDEFMVFYPSMPGNNCKGYGEFGNIKDFEEVILKDEVFHEYCLYPISPEDIPILIQNLGELEDEQIFYPKLDPALGGSLELDEFDKGNVWVRTEILGQNRGIE
ncbi:hypothetical protein [uncultured Pseudoteredinibacter sp.]|uniref:hypothetical protein n=1 Tax=uncultured Pseudoteredinibacter sp. TaxID=1641701 RepID=UPI00260617F0|nr:hypothetical protein [uncultured Pseudoteredinibacter sp.]